MSEIAERKPYNHVDHEQLAVLLVQGYSPSKAAAELEVDRATVYRAMKDPRYLAAKDQLTNGLADEIAVNTLGSLWRVSGFLADKATEEFGDEEESAVEAEKRASACSKYATAKAKVDSALLAVVLPQLRESAPAVVVPSTPPPRARTLPPA